MLIGNLQIAEKPLKRVIDIEPDYAEIHYRLIFIKSQSKNHEAALFYANEALEYGLSIDEEIKISALMGYVYATLRLTPCSKEQFNHASSLDSTNVWILFIDKHQNLILLGTPGASKTLLAVGLGIEAIQKGFQVYFVTMGELIQLLKTEEFTHRAQIQLKRLRASDMIIIDDVMYMALDQ